MNTDFLVNLNISVGMKGAGGAPAGDAFFTGDGMSFGDVLGQTAAATAVVPQNDDGAQNNIFGEENTGSGNVTFAQLTRELAGKIDSADSSVIAAAMKLMLSVGKVVEKLFGTGGISGPEMEEAPDSAADILAMLINSIPEEIITEDEVLAEDEVLPEEITDEIITEEITDDFEEEITDDEFAGKANAADMLGSLSSAIRSGLSEGKDTEEIISEVKASVSGNAPDKNSLANAVMTVLCMLSGYDIRSDIFDLSQAEENITAEALGKLADISGVMSSNISASEKAEAVERLIYGEEDEVLEEDEVKFSEYTERPERTFAHRPGHSTAHSLRINNASAQAEEISINRAGVRNDAAGINVQLPASEGAVFTEEETTAIFRELGEYISTQLTERITEEVPQLSGTESTRELTMVLRPRELGEVAVRITADQNGAVSLVLSAANAEVGRAISENAAALSESLSKQNIEVKSIDVVNPSEASSYMGLDFTNQGFERRGYEESDPENRTGRRTRGRISAVSADISTADTARAERLLKEAKLWATA